VPFLIGFNLFNNKNEFSVNNHSLNGTNNPKTMNGGFGFTKSNEEINGTLLFNQSNIQFYKLDFN
jgi:hypothetical protein